MIMNPIIMGGDLGMALYYDGQGNLTMVPANEGKRVDHNEVSVYSYINAFNAADASWFGTTRFGAQETLSGGNTSITLKKYGVCDYDIDMESLEFDEEDICGLFAARYQGGPLLLVGLRISGYTFLLYGVP